MQKLIPLEVEESHETETTHPVIDTPEETEENDHQRAMDTDDNSKSTRPKRTATIEARDKIFATLCEN